MPAPSLPPAACPGIQAMVVAVFEGQWQTLEAWHRQGNLLAQLWDPAHIHRAHPLSQGRIRRLSAGAALLRKGIVRAPEATQALSLLLSWSFTDAIFVEEKDAWREAFSALNKAGVPLRAPREASFESWAAADPWACLAQNPLFHAVIVDVVRDGSLPAWVPPAPHLRAWPADPTAELLANWEDDELEQAWLLALEHGYRVEGATGQQWLRRAIQWDRQGLGVARALAQGGVDVHARTDSATLLESWIEGLVPPHCPPAAVLALLRHDPSVLDDTTALECPLHGVLMDYLARHQKHMDELGLQDAAVAQVRALAMARRRARDMDRGLPAARTARDASRL